MDTECRGDCICRVLVDMGSLFVVLTSVDISSHAILTKNYMHSICIQHNSVIEHDCKHISQKRFPFHFQIVLNFDRPIGINLQVLLNIFFFLISEKSSGSHFCKYV
jgi:hypothetical protein